MIRFPNASASAALVCGWQAEALADEIRRSGERMALYAMDEERTRYLAAGDTLNWQDQGAVPTVEALLAVMARQGHQTGLVIFRPAPATAEMTRATPVATVEQRWRQTGMPLFLLSQTVIRHMLKAGTASDPRTLIALGSVLATHPRSDFSAESALYAGMRALIQSLAREFQPKGIHVAHVGLAGDTALHSMAGLCLQLHRQPSSAWTQEVALAGGG